MKKINVSGWGTAKTAIRVISGRVCKFRSSRIPLCIVLQMGVLLGGTAGAQTTYTWANSNVTGTPAASLNWLNAPQGTWAGGTPDSSNLNTIQFFQDTTMALLNTAAPSDQTSVIDTVGDAAFELGTLTLSGLASATANANLTMTISGDPLNFSAATGTINLNALNATRIITYNLNSAIQLGTAGSAGALTLTGNGTGAFNIGGIINELQTGGGSLIKSGNSAVTLIGANSYTGGTVINAGFLQFNSGAVPATGQITINSAGVLPATGAYTSAGAWLGSNKIGTGSAGVLALTAANGANVNFTGYDNLYLGATGTFAFGAYTLTPGANGYLLGGGGGTLTFGTAGTLAAGKNLTVGGNVTLSAANTAFNGTVAVNAGTLTLATPTALGTTIPSITGAGNVRFFVGSGVTFTLGVTSSYLGSTTFEPASSQACYLNLATANALPTTTVLKFVAVTGAGSGRTAAFDLKGFSQELGGLDNGGLNGESRNQRVTNTGALATLTINNTGNYKFGGSFKTLSSTTTAQIDGNIALTKSGSGTFTLDGTHTAGAAEPGNTFTGPTQILGGILVLGDTPSLQNSAFDTAGSIAGDAVNGLRTTKTALTLGGLSGDKNLAAVFTTTTGGYSGLTALTLNPGAGAAPSYSGIIANGAANMTLTKSGAGTQTLSGANTYTGATTINDGTLLGVVGGYCTNSDVTVVSSLGVSVTDNTKQWICKSLTTSGAPTLTFDFEGVTPSTTLAPLKVDGAATFTVTPKVVITNGVWTVRYPLMTWGSTSGTPPGTPDLISGAGIYGKLSVDGNTLYFTPMSGTLVSFF